jgi:hypothetical protein
MSEDREVDTQKPVTVPTYGSNVVAPKRDDLALDSDTIERPGERSSGVEAADEYNLFNAAADGIFATYTAELGAEAEAVHA